MIRLLDWPGETEVEITSDRARAAGRAVASTRAVISAEITQLADAPHHPSCAETSANPYMSSDLYDIGTGVQFGISGNLPDATSLRLWRSSNTYDQLICNSHAKSRFNGLEMLHDPTCLIKKAKFALPASEFCDRLRLRTPVAAAPGRELE